MHSEVIFIKNAGAFQRDTTYWHFIVAQVLAASRAIMALGGVYEDVIYEAIILKNALLEVKPIWHTDGQLKISLKQSWKMISWPLNNDLIIQFYAYM